MSSIKNASEKQFIFIQGATASGKSELALEVAEGLGSAAIINCDSIQTYTRVDIGAAKPSANDLRRVPHYLYSYVEPLRELTAGQYSRDFWSLIDKIKATYSYFVIVGGTGFYFQAIEKGMFPVKDVPEELMKSLEAELEDEGASKLYGELQSRDPESAKRIHINDHYRLVRALALIRNEQSTLGEIQGRHEIKKFPYPLKKYFVDWSREQLIERIDLRTQLMLKKGLVDEVKELLNDGLANWAPLRSVGYKETVSYLGGEMKSLSDLHEKINISTRQLAKRQVTWFKRDLDLSRVELSGAKHKILGDLL